MGLVPVNKIIPLSMVDGPGCRTSIFLQACNISCAYCHNPETKKLCCHCGICVSQCPEGALSISDGKVIWDEALCTWCDTCINVCPYEATPRINMMDAKEVFNKVMESVPFIQGITVSGGECTLYPDFLQELFLMVKSVGLTSLIDSNGMIDLSLYPKLIEACDGIMLDVKSWDDAIGRKLTGAATNDMVKKNLKYLADQDKIEELRIVCLPNEVDAEDIIAGIASHIPDKIELIKLKLIKFRHYGVKGRLKDMKSPDDQYMQELLDKATDLGFKKVKII